MTHDHTDVHELPNVEGVAEEDDGTVIAFVVAKESEDDLDDGDLVRNQSSVANYETDVIDLGGEVRPLTDMIDGSEETVSPQQLVTRQKHRPIVSGVSEMLSSKERSFATNGPLVEVQDTSTAEYASWVKEGDICRLSNNHVYANIDRATFGDHISQPSPVHASSDNSFVGEYIGSVPIEDGVPVDAALRSMSGDANESYSTIRGKQSGVRRDNLSTMKGGQMTICGGARTGYDSAEVLATNLSVNVNYGPDKGTVTVTDCIATKSMSAGGDSGTPAAYDSELVALNFAGSSNVSILCKLTNIEEQLGVKVRTSPPTDVPKEPTWENVSSFSDDQYEYQIRRKEAQS